jgi:hypothetical protein
MSGTPCCLCLGPLGADSSQQQAVGGVFEDGENVVFVILESYISDGCP